MPTWNEFAWAAFLYGAISSGDRDYQNLMNQTQFLINLRTNPNRIVVNQIQRQVIQGFLNRWKCRVENNPQSAKIIQTMLQNILPFLQVLNDLAIVTANFTQVVNVNNNQMTVKEVINHCYTTLRKIGYRFAATATSKLLHILQPELFLMWDKDILAHYSENDPQITDSGRGYCIYLQMMQQVAKQVYQSFQNTTLNPPAGESQNPANYLSTQMNYIPPKTLVKYLDEYNWVTITNGVKVPPPWHP